MTQKRVIKFCGWHKIINLLWWEPTVTCCGLTDKIDWAITCLIKFSETNVMWYQSFKTVLASEKVDSELAVTLQEWKQNYRIECRIVEYPELNDFHWGSQIPTPGSTQHCPKSKPYVWEHCLNAPWTLQAWGYDPGQPGPCPLPSGWDHFPNSHLTLPWHSCMPFPWVLLLSPKSREQLFV